MVQRKTLKPGTVFRYVANNSNLIYYVHCNKALKETIPTKYQNARVSLANHSIKAVEILWEPGQRTENEWGEVTP